MSSKMYLINSKNPFFIRNRGVSPAQLAAMGFNSMWEMRVKMFLMPDNGGRRIPEEAPCHDCEVEHCYNNNEMCYYFKHLLMQCNLISDSDDQKMSDKSSDPQKCQTKDENINDDAASAPDEMSDKKSKNKSHRKTIRLTDEQYEKWDSNIVRQLIDDFVELSDNDEGPIIKMSDKIENVGKSQTKTIYDLNLKIRNLHDQLNTHLIYRGMLKKLIPSFKKFGVKVSGLDPDEKKIIYKLAEEIRNGR